MFKRSAALQNKTMALVKKKNSKLSYVNSKKLANLNDYRRIKQTVKKILELSLNLGSLSTFTL